MYTLKLESGMQVGGPIGSRDNAITQATRLANKRDEQVDVICPNGETITVSPSNS